ncbi:MAG: phosphotransferase [Armatimonadetes bacterium]|nr:phosphotransferase [Armatimonadota bacterium]
MNDWRPDVPLDLATAHAIVARRFPSFAGQTPVEVGRGWDNLCLAYGDGTAFRMPTRAVAAEIVLNEIAALPALAPLLPLPVPDIKLVGEPGDDFPYPFFGFALLPGETADRSTWPDVALMLAAEALGTFLRALHAIPFTEKPLSALPGDLIARADPLRLLGRIVNRAAEIAGQRPDRASWAQGLQRRADALLQGLVLDGVRTVVHGDLYPRHVLADDACLLTGVIDWGDVHIGHPGVDLSLAFTFFSGPSRAAFWQAYGGGPDPSTLRLAQARACNYALALCAYGLDVGDPSAVELADEIAARSARP